MKNTTRKNTDAIAEARKNKKFREYSKNAFLRLRLGIEVYDGREKLGLSQQELAREIGSTQKVISRIESGEVNVGIELLSRLINKLNFNSNTLAKIFDCCTWIVIKPSSGKSQSNRESKVLNNAFIKIKN